MAICRRWRVTLIVGVLGNVENRRVVDFCAAAHRAGIETRSLAWADWLDDQPAVANQLQKADRVRIDSIGENPVVLEKLLNLKVDAGEPVESPLAHGELRALDRIHFGFLQQLKQLEQLDVSFLNAPRDIRQMFDKWQSHQRFQSAGLNRPHTFLAANKVNEFREQIRTHAKTLGCRSARVFLKPRYASSGSGVCAIHLTPDREVLVAPIELDNKRSQIRLFNSLKVRRYRDPASIEAVLQHLLQESMIAEHWIPKARLPDGRFDFRVVVIDRTARHVVVRQSDRPMTNLHLGNRRGCLDEAVEFIGPKVYREVLSVAEEATACFPDSLYAGVDVIVSSSLEVSVCEINAFGDLLPGLRDRDETTYEAIVRAIR